MLPKGKTLLFQANDEHSTVMTLEEIPWESLTHSNTLNFTQLALPKPIQNRKPCDFLRRFKGKKIMYIGDSISLYQSQSMVCLFHVVVPDQSKIFQNANGPITTVIFQVSQLCHPPTNPL